MVGKIHIDEIRQRVTDHEDGPYDWVDPRNIAGLDLEDARRENKEEWFIQVTRAYVESIGEGEDTDDGVITDYLRDCINGQNSTCICQKKLVPITDFMFIDAAIFLIEEMGSSYAAVILIVYRKIVEKENLQACFDMVRQALERTREPFIIDIWRDFMLDLFEFGPLWHAKTSPSRYLDKASVDFLQQILDDGYVTIDNKDARYFSDGRARWKRYPDKVDQTGS